MKDIYFKIGAVVALVIAITALLTGGKTVVIEPPLGGSSDSGWNATGDGCISVDGTCVISSSGAITIGANGSTVNELKATTCDIFVGGGAAIAATSTVVRSCTVTGVNTNDIVFAQFPTTTGVMAGWDIMGATAMNGSVDIQIVNNTGGSAVLPAALASSTRIFYIDN